VGADEGEAEQGQVVVPESIAANARSLRAWIQRAVQHAHSA